MKNQLEKAFAGKNDRRRRSVMTNITEAFRDKTLVITGGTGSFASA